MYLQVLVAVLLAFVQPKLLKAESSCLGLGRNLVPSHSLAELRRAPEPTLERAPTYAPTAVNNAFGGDYCKNCFSRYDDDAKHASPERTPSTESMTSHHAPERHVTIIARSRNQGFDDFGASVAVHHRLFATRGGQAVEKGFFGGTKYTQKVIEQMKKGVGEFHSFTESVTAFEKAGTIKTITGGDGVVRQMLEIPGSYQSSIVRSGGPMSQTENYALLLDEKGVSLHALGLEDISLCRTDALRAIELIRSSSRAILGGDVYFQRAGGIEIAYANWHTDREIGENSTDYVVRSCHESKNYIESFPHLEAAVPLFVFVVSELEDSAR